MKSEKILGSLNKDQICNLRLSPYLLIKGQEDGWVSIPVSVFVIHKFKSTPYEINGSDFRIVVGSEIVTETIPIDLLKSTNSTFFNFTSIMTNKLGTDLVGALGKDVYLINIGPSDVSGGDGDVLFEISCSFFDSRK